MAQGSNILDDKFSEVIPLGFNFCFYDNLYSNIVIGANGILSFDVKDAKADNPNVVLVQNPHHDLIDKAIFAIQHDLQFDLSSDSEIYYYTIGKAPCRRFIINYFNAQHYKCDKKSTFQIVLHEFTNEIDVHILEKPKSCDNGRNHNSLLGINRDGKQGISPPNRNTGIWTAYKESWKFKPKGNKQPEIIWTNEDDDVVGTSREINVCPVKNTKYTATVKYNSCDGNTLIVQDDIQINIDAEFPLIKNNNIFVCDSKNDGIENITLANFNQDISYNNSDLFTFKYFSDPSYTVPITSLVLNGSKTVYLKIISKKNPNCLLKSAINLNFSTSMIGDLKIQMCDNNSDGRENGIDLKPHVENLLKDLTYKFFTTHKTESDAINHENPITKMNLNANSEFWIYVKIYDGCEKVFGPVTVSFKAAPPIRNTKPIKYSACDINYDHMEPFEWNIEIPRAMEIKPGEKFTVHKSYGEAVRKINVQENISDKNTEYYVRIQNSRGCYTIIKQPVEIMFTGVNAIPKSIYICFDGIEDKEINLLDYYSDMLIDPIEGVEIYAYSDNDSAENNILKNVIPPNQVISEDGYLVKKTFFIRFQIAEDCYTIRPIHIYLIHPISKADPILVCDLYNDNDENNILSIYDEQILGDQEGAIKYFVDDTYTESISSYHFTSLETTLYIEIKSHNCIERYPVIFKMNEVPPVHDITINIGSACDLDQNGVSELDITGFINKVYTEKNEATFTFYKNFDHKTKSLEDKINDPTKFPVTNTTTIFYIQIQSKDYRCSAVAKVEVKTDMNLIFEINDSELFTCDHDGDLNETFILDDIVDQIKNSLSDFDSSLYTIKFYEKKDDAEKETNELESNTYIPNAAIYDLYVRVQHIISGCYDIKKLTLNTLAPPKPTRGEITICDTNFNNQYDLDLNLLPNIIMNELDGFSFKYYLTRDDAIEANSKNIDNKIIFEAKPFPKEIWVRVERTNLKDCFDVQPVEISFNPIALDLDEDEFDVNGCDENNNGYSILNLTAIEKYYHNTDYAFTYYESFNDIINRTNEIKNPKSYSNPKAYLKEVYVVVDKEGVCPAYAKINLIYNTILVNVNNVKFCPLESADIITEIQDEVSKYNFIWKDENGIVISNEPNLYNINEEKTFNLIVSNKNYSNCKKEFQIHVSHYDIPLITNVEIDENYNATVSATGTYPIEYSINGIEWQSSNIFHNLPIAIQTFWVRYKDQKCIGLPWESVILFIPNVITPNGDGKNDCITIKDLEILGRGTPSTLIVYDRYGKEIFKKENKHRIEWCGDYLDRTLNSTDYWYRLILPNGKEKRGNITVKNINFEK